MEAGENSEMINKNGCPDVELKDGIVHDSTTDQDDDGRKNELEDERGDARTEEAAEESQRKEMSWYIPLIPFHPGTSRSSTHSRQDFHSRLFQFISANKHR